MSERTHRRARCILLACAAWIACICGASAAPVGVNIEGVADWARLTPFVDLMKSSRRWGNAKAPWVPDVAVDALGWPTQDAGVVVRVLSADAGVADRGRQYLPPGVYALSFSGKATVRPVASASVTVRDYAYDPRADRSTARVVVGASAAQLMLAFENTHGGVRDVRLLQPGYRAEQTFSDEFKRAIAPFTTLRLMDFLATNGNPVAAWSERTTPGAATQSGPKGAALEYAVQLANETGKDIWINVPVGADDAYVRSLAELMHRSLDPARAVYIEYSNELWNSVFDQTRQNMEAAVAEAMGGDVSLTRGVRCTQEAFLAARECNPYWAGYFRIGKRTTAISRIFSSVFGPDAMNTRIRPVLATQFANPSIAEQVLKNMAKYRGKPSALLYGIASAPYFYLAKDMSTSPNLGVDAILASLETSLDTQLLPVFAAGVVDRGAFRANVRYDGRDWSAPSQRELANYYGLHSLAYEGGPDLRQNPASTPAKTEANLDERMGRMVQRMLDRWYGCGNDLFVYYNLSSGYGRAGYWGLTNDPGRLDVPKYRAAASFAAQPLPDPRRCD